MKFFLDANIPYSALTAIKELNLEAIHAKDAGLSQASDKEIAKYAEKSKSILVTKDLDFGNLKLFDAKPCGLVILRLPHFFKAPQFINVLRDFLKSENAQNLEGAITIVKLGSYRTRKLEKA